MNQIFTKIPNKNLLFDLLNKICNYHEEYYRINKSVFKLANYYELLKSFCEELTPYYHKSKIFYINRQMNYKNFLTVIRQLCNSHNINFIYFNSFHDSTYEIVYKIFKNTNTLLDNKAVLPKTD